MIIKIEDYDFAQEKSTYPIIYIAIQYYRTYLTKNSIPYHSLISLIALISSTSKANRNAVF